MPAAHQRRLGRHCTCSREYPRSGMHDEENALSEQRAKLLSVVAAMLTEVIGEDAEFMAPITTETSFSDDLELESIEFVVLAEKLEQRFGAEVDFVTWLGQREIEEIINLRVGELVEFLESCLT